MRPRTQFLRFDQNWRRNPRILRKVHESSLIVPLLITGFGLGLGDRVTAQTYTALHKFSAVSGNRTNSDGASPDCGLILLGGTLFGATRQGGASGYGTVFKVKTNGTGFTVLHSFTDNTFGTNGGGTTRVAKLVASGNKLYG
jgi:uncharacterized repeat protein (TIGR03803 family)